MWEICSSAREQNSSLGFSAATCFFSLYIRGVFGGILHLFLPLLSLSWCQANNGTTFFFHVSIYLVQALFIYCFFFSICELFFARVSSSSPVSRGERTKAPTLPKTSHCAPTTRRSRSSPTPTSPSLKQQPGVGGMTSTIFVQICSKKYLYLYFYFNEFFLNDEVLLSWCSPSELNKPFLATTFDF